MEDGGGRLCCGWGRGLCKSGTVSWDAGLLTSLEYVNGEGNNGSEEIVLYLRGG